jgi:hypothetical protein
MTETRRGVTARDWLACVALGVLLVVLGLTTAGGTVAAVGLLLAVVGAFGVAWRLLENR